jgi:hypothetical protein
VTRAQQIDLEIARLRGRLDGLEDRVVDMRPATFACACIEMRCDVELLQALVRDVRTGGESS